MDSDLQPWDQVFATLDVTCHAGYLGNRMKVVYMDTVGFISNIPTNLIEAFSATLEDVSRAVSHICYSASVTFYAFYLFFNSDQFKSDPIAKAAKTVRHRLLACYWKLPKVWKPFHHLFHVITFVNFWSITIKQKQFPILFWAVWKLDIELDAWTTTDKIEFSGF